jgi:hypothetical protein
LEFAAINGMDEPKSSDKLGLYQRYKAWEARHFNRPSSQLALGELLFCTIFLWIPFAKRIDWSTAWQFPVGQGEPSPWGVATLSLGIGLFFLVHGFGNLKNWSWALAINAVIGLTLIVAVAGYIIGLPAGLRFPSGEGWHLFDKFGLVLWNWMFALIVAWGGFNLIREARYRFWPPKSREVDEAWQSSLHGDTDSH